MILRCLICFVISISLLSCQSETVEVQAPSTLINGTQQMMDSIAKIKSRVNYRRSLYDSKQKVALIQKEVKAGEQKGRVNPQLYLEYINALLEAGSTKEALELLGRLLEVLPQNKAINKQTKALHETIALGFLRLGEQKNCIQNHSEESCLFPIKGSGIHLDKAPSQSAIQKYEEILAVFPNDLRSRWLLNLAYMTIGEYPQKVPKKYLIDPNVFSSEEKISEFKNIASSTGLDIEDLAGGIILDDLNNDNHIDIIASSWGLFGQIRIFFNNGHGQFIDQTASSNLQGLVGGLNLIQADFNNDGFLDFYIIRGAWRGANWMGPLPNSLILNNGDGTFKDVSIQSGVYDPSPTQSAVWVDFNRDGWLDLFVGNETHDVTEPYPCRLFINQKDGTFIDKAPELGIDYKYYVKGVASSDVNNDGYPDLYVSILNRPNNMILNLGGTDWNNWGIEEVGMLWGVQEPFESFPTWFFDYDNDGWDDLFVSSFDTYSFKQQSREVAADFIGEKVNSDWPRLYRNKEGNGFENITSNVGLNKIVPTMGCNFGDINNDGWLDFYLGTGSPDFRAIVPNRMFQNQKGTKFKDVTFAGNFGNIQKGHGIAFADLDRDGDQDIYAVMGGSVSGDVAHNNLFENPGSSNAWTNLELEGKQSNRSAIGAKVKLIVELKNGSIQEIYHTVNSGASFGANSLNLEIGLGDAKEVKDLQINWPNKENSYISYGSIQMNQFIKIVEGNEKLSYLNLAVTPLVKGSHSHSHH